MKQPAPKVYIDDRLMDAYAIQKVPVLAGMKIIYGTASDLDMPEADTLQLELLVRGTADLGFLELGKIVAVCHVPADGSAGYTYFVGRIQRATADIEVHVPVVGGPAQTRQRIHLDATGMIADLENETAYDVDLPATVGQTRAHALGNMAPAGWSMLTFAIRFPTRPHARIRYEEKPYLELLDLFLRAQIMTRADYSIYTPGTGVQRRFLLFQNTNRDMTVDILTKNPDGSWGVWSGSPSSGQYGTVRLDGRHFHADVGWTKEPDDVITEVSVSRASTPADADTKMKPGSSMRFYPGAAAARERFGIRSVEFETDLPADGWGQQSFDTVKPIWDNWIAVESSWRPSALRLKDTDDLDPATLRTLLEAGGRGRVFLAVRHLAENRPDSGRADIRGVIIGGTAVWTGQKWELSFTLGRTPAHNPAGDWWSFDRIGGTLWEPDAGDYDMTTADTVGNELSFDDFKRIGNPYT